MCVIIFLHITMKVFQVNDVLYIMGNDAKENWRLLEEAKEDDIWVHLNGYPSSYVIIKNINRDSKLNMEAIVYAGQLCKHYSKHKHIKNMKMCYLEAKYVSKGKITGQAKCLKEPNIKMIRWLSMSLKGLPHYSRDVL